MWCTFIILVGVLLFFGLRFAKQNNVKIGWGKFSWGGEENKKE